MKAGVAPRPIINKIIGTHHPGISGGTLSEIERTVGTKKKIIVLVIPQRRQPADEILPLIAFKIEGGDLAAVGKEQRALF